MGKETVGFVQKLFSVTPEFILIVIESPPGDVLGTSWHTWLCNIFGVLISGGTLLLEPTTLLPSQQFLNARVLSKMCSCIIRHVPFAELTSCVAPCVSVYFSLSLLLMSNFFFCFSMMNIWYSLFLFFYYITFIITFSLIKTTHKHSNFLYVLIISCLLNVDEEWLIYIRFF